MKYLLIFQYEYIAPTRRVVDSVHVLGVGMATVVFKDGCWSVCTISIMGERERKRERQKDRKSDRGWKEMMIHRRNQESVHTQMKRDEVYAFVDKFAVMRAG